MHNCIVLPSSSPMTCKAVSANFVLDLASAGCSACASDSDENRMCSLSTAFLWWEYFQLFPPNFLFSLFSFQFYGIIQHSYIIVGCYVFVIGPCVHCCYFHYLVLQNTTLKDLPIVYQIWCILEVDPSPLDILDTVVLKDIKHEF